MAKHMTRKFESMGIAVGWITVDIPRKPEARKT
jgi:hypothetical protein